MLTRALAGLLVISLALAVHSSAEATGIPMPITGSLCQDVRTETSTQPPENWGTSGDPSADDYDACLAGSTTTGPPPTFSNIEDQGSICYAFAAVPTLCHHAWVGSQRTGHTHECAGMTPGQVCLQFAMYYEAISAIFQSGEGHGMPHHGTPGGSNPGSLRNDVCVFTATIPECSDTALGHMGMVPSTDPNCVDHEAWALTTSIPFYGGTPRIGLSTDCESF